MGWKGSLISLVVHAGAIAAIGLAVSEEGRRAAIAVAVRTLDRDELEKKGPPPEKPKEPPKPAEKKARPAAPKPVQPATPEVAPEKPADAGKVIDLGIMLGADAPSGIGIAVPSADPFLSTKPKLPAEKPAEKPKILREKARAEAECTVAPSKPVPVEKVAIEYPIEAREAGIAGRLVARVFVDERGEVEKVELIESAGELIDRAAIDALERWKFTAASACGRAVKAQYTVARRFELGD